MCQGFDQGSEWQIYETTVTIHFNWDGENVVAYTEDPVHIMNARRLNDLTEEWK